jgi:hypothetical protein
MQIRVYHPVLLPAFRINDLASSHQSLVLIYLMS